MNGMTVNVLTIEDFSGKLKENTEKLNSALNLTSFRLLQQQHNIY